jgi:hypothetical protein
MANSSYIFVQTKKYTCPVADPPVVVLVQYPKSQVPVQSACQPLGQEQPFLICQPFAAAFATSFGSVLVLGVGSKYAGGVGVPTKSTPPQPILQ